MGWSIHIKTDKPITESVVESVIADLPASMREGHGYGGKQNWGWSLAVDVSIFKPQELLLSGSFGMSGQIAEGFAEAFARRLEKRKFNVTISPLR